MAFTDVAQEEITFELYFYTHTRALAAVEYASGNYPSPTIKTDIVFEGLSGADVQLSKLPEALAHSDFPVVPMNEPFPIICYFNQLTSDCVISSKPFCAVGTFNEDKTDMTALPVEVNFMSDIFVKMGGLDDFAGGFVQYRGHMQASNSDGTLFGTPTDITGIVIPIPETERTASAPPSPSISGDCECCIILQFILIIAVIVVPYSLSMVLQQSHVLDKELEHLAVGLTFSALFIIWLVVMTYNPFVAWLFRPFFQLMYDMGCYCSYTWINQEVFEPYPRQNLPPPYSPLV